MANLSSKIQGVSQAAIPPVGPVYPVVTFGGATGLTVSTTQLYFHRVGELLLVNGRITVTGTGTDASNFTVNLAGLTLGANQGGGVRVEETTSTEVWDYHALGSGGVINFYDANLEAAGTALLGTEISSATSGEIQNFYFQNCAFIVTEWIGSSQQQANTHQVEYAYNSSGITAAGASDTTSFAYGAGGASVGAIASTTAASNTTMRVRFRSEIQPTDIVELQFKTANGPWMSAVQAGAGKTAQNTSLYGADIIAVNSTDVDVRFANKGSLPYGSASLGGDGIGWTSTAFSWRVRKVSGGIQGFGNATTTTPGLVTLAQLTPVTDWADVTLVFSNDATAPHSAKWRRNATNLEIECSGRWTTGTSGQAGFTIPFGLTALTDGYQGTGWPAGTWSNSGSETLSGNLNIDTTTLIKFVRYDITGYSPTSAQAYWYFRASIPISQWAGSLPGLVSDAQVEFVYNSDTSTSSDSVSFATGSGGVNFAAYAPTLTNTIVKKVRFPTAATATDVVQIEISNATGVWIPLSQSTFNFFTNDAGSTYYGMYLAHVNSTDFDVRICSQPVPGSGWSAMSAYKWRVKKVKSSISALVDNATATSYGLVRGGYVPGKTDGVAIVTGNVGEKVVSANWSNYTASASVSDVTGATITLTAGVWRLFYSVAANVATGASSGNDTRLVVRITDSANTTVGNSQRGFYIKTVAAVANNSISCLTAEEIVNISATTTYKLRAHRADGSGTGSGIVIASNDGDFSGTFHAVRIA